MERFSDWDIGVQVAAATVVLVLIAVLGVFDGSQFIYFQF